MKALSFQSPISNPQSPLHYFPVCTHFRHAVSSAGMSFQPAAANTSVAVGVVPFSFGRKPKTTFVKLSLPGP